MTNVSRLRTPGLKVPCKAHGVGRVVGALGSEAGFAGSMLNWVISMMHVLHYHKNPKLQLSGLKLKKVPCKGERS